MYVLFISMLLTDEGVRYMKHTLWTSPAQDQSAQLTSVICKSWEISSKWISH